MKEFWKEIRDYVFIILAVVLIRTFITTPAIVDGDSMNDNLLDGQVVFINKLVYRFKNIKRFDVVVINNKKENDRLIKRVIGLPNEEIEYLDNKLYINGNLVETNITFKNTDNFKAKTGKDEYFVLGDNRPRSKDSRMLGSFNKSDIVGKVRLRIFPLNKIGIIK